MREPARITTPFEGYERQVFPQGLSALNEIYADFGVIYEDTQFGRKGERKKQLEKFKDSITSGRGLDVGLLDWPRTQDGYTWQVGLTLSSGHCAERDIAVLFPDSSGHSNYHTNLRRSIGIYVRPEVNENAVNLVLEELILGIMGVKKPEV